MFLTASPSSSFVVVVYSRTHAHNRYNEFRDLKRGCAYTGHKDCERHVAIYDIDKDKWQVITTDYVIDNCCRFDEKTGEPLGFYHPRVQRHKIHYTPTQMLDSYHFLWKNSNHQMVMMPCRYFGQISLESVTLKDIWTAAEVSNEKMTDLHQKFDTGKMKGVVDGGLEVLAYMESLSYDEAAEKWIEAVRDYNVETRGYGLSRGGSGSAFSPGFLTELFGQNTHSGWDLPPTGRDRAWVMHQMPFGYGHVSGFLSIAAAFAEAGDAARFEDRYKFSGGMAQKVHEFVQFLVQYLHYLKLFYLMCPALDEAYAAPWWLYPSALHTLWDAVVAPQHRLPFHVRPKGRNAPVVGAGAQPRSQIIDDTVGMSQTALDFIDDRLIGRTNTLEVMSAHRQPIGAYIGRTEDGGTKSVVFDPSQRAESKTVDIDTQEHADELLELLPAFTRVFYRVYNRDGTSTDRNTFYDGDGVKFYATNGIRMRVVNLGEGGYAVEPDEHKAVRDARDLLLALEYHTKQDESVAHPLTTAALQVSVRRATVRSLLLIAMTTLAMGDTEETETLEAQSAHARRIIQIYKMVIEPFIPSASLLEPGRPGLARDAVLLDHIDPKAFIERFRSEALRALHGSVPQNPFKFKLPEDVERTVQYMQRNIETRDRIVAELNRQIAEGTASSDVHTAVAIQDYIPSPLVYSPKQLVTHYEYVYEKNHANPIALPASTDQPVTPMTMVLEQANARAVRAVMAGPSEETIRNLHANLVPLGIGMGMPIHHNSIVMHQRRERLVHQDRVRGARQSAMAAVGAPGTPTEAMGAMSMSDDMHEDIAALDPMMTAHGASHMRGSARAHEPLTFQERMAISGGVTPEGYIPELGRKFTRGDGGYGRQVSSSTFSAGVHPDSYDLAVDKRRDESRRLRAFSGVDSNLHDMLTTVNFVDAWEAIDRQSESRIASWTAKVYLLTPFNAKVLHNWAHRDLLVPIRALLFRFCVLGTYGIIKVAATSMFWSNFIPRSKQA